MISANDFDHDYGYSQSRWVRNIYFLQTTLRHNILYYRERIFDQLPNFESNSFSKLLESSLLEQFDDHGSRF